MDLPFSSTAPAKLYALQLKLRPLQRGSLMPFSGELVHAAWLEWIRSAAPDVAEFLHDGNKRRLFTCSSLQFPLPVKQVREAQRENVHLPLNPEKVYSVRVTLLLGELFPLFYNSLLFFNMTELGAKKAPFMQIGKNVFLLEEVVANGDNRSAWTGFTSFSTLVEKARALKLGSVEDVTLEFGSLTVIKWINTLNKTYGNYYALMPLPRYVFPALARRWQELAPAELVDLVQKEAIEEYVQADGVIIDNYDLQTNWVTFVNHPQRGFAGTCTYHLRGPDEQTTAKGSLNVRQQILLLAQLAFYTGVGYKTAMGMGQVRPL